MNTKSSKLFLISYFILFIGCGDGLETRKIVGRYYLVALDYLEEETNLGYEWEEGGFISVVPAKVVALGFNKSYIIAMQVPPNRSEIDSSVAKYYIVPIYSEQTSTPEVGVIGPLNIMEFEVKVKELKIDNINFKRY
jgi:hypothetical protein